VNIAKTHTSKICPERTKSLTAPKRDITSYNNTIIYIKAIKERKIPTNENIFIITELVVKNNCSRGVDARGNIKYPTRNIEYRREEFLPEARNLVFSVEF